MTRSRREFLRDVGISAAALPFVLNLPSLGFANQQARKQRLVVMFSPDGVVPWNFWPEEEGSEFTLKESLTPLEPLKDRMLTLHGVCDRIRGDGDNHMRGIGCLLTGIELFPGNIQGGSHTPAGWASGISIDQEIKNYLQAKPETKTRFGSLEFGVMVPDRADTWTRMSIRGAEQADDADRRSVSDVRQALRPHEGPREPEERARRAAGRPEESQRHRQPGGSPAAWKSTPRSSASSSRSCGPAATSVGHAVPELEPGVKEENDNIPKITKLQIELMVSSFAADFARVATLQMTNSVGGARFRWLGIDEGQHELSHHEDSKTESQEKLTKINKWYCEQFAYLAQRLAETPEPGGNGSLLDNTLLLWTNELGKGN